MTIQLGGRSVQEIITPNVCRIALRAVITLMWLQVVAAAREHFSCPDINGARVENEGGLLTQGYVYCVEWLTAGRIECCFGNTLTS